MFSITSCCFIKKKKKNLFQIKCLSSSCSIFFSTASRSLHLVTQCPPSAATTWCTTGSRAWLSACTGMCGSAKHGWQTPPTRRTRRTEAASAVHRMLTRGQSSQQVKPWAASRYLTSLACKLYKLCAVSTRFYPVSHSSTHLFYHYIRAHSIEIA